MLRASTRLVHGTQTGRMVFSYHICYRASGVLRCSDGKFTYLYIPIFGVQCSLFSDEHLEMDTCLAGTTTVISSWLKCKKRIKLEGGGFACSLLLQFCVRLATDNYYIPILIMDGSKQFVDSYNRYSEYPKNLVDDRNPHKSDKYKKEVDKHGQYLFRTDSDDATYIVVPIRDYGVVSQGLAPTHLLNFYNLTLR